MTELILNKRIKQNKKQTQNRINPKQTFQTPSKRKPRVLKPWPQTSLPHNGTSLLPHNGTSLQLALNFSASLPRDGTPNQNSGITHGAASLILYLISYIKQQLS